MAAAQYLDMLADVYLCLPRREAAYHDWPARAARTLGDLSFSPACTSLRGGRRYLMPYVGDEAKPPESMVQLTLAVNTGEYDRWRDQPSVFGEAMRATVPSFFDEEVGSVVRWLPGADFGASQAEENMNHAAMDSWYLHHSLFNLSRLASEGDERAKELLRRSLPYAIRVARRFAYRWPIFFNLRNLDVIRAESAPGVGGETDVGGLYALVMLHALELFGIPSFSRRRSAVWSTPRPRLHARIPTEHDRFRRGGRAEAVVPADLIAERSRNWRLERTLSVPLEDLQDGHAPSGQVGQELYGAGMPFVNTSRHYRRVPAAGCLERAAGARSKRRRPLSRRVLFRSSIRRNGCARDASGTNATCCAHF